MFKKDKPTTLEPIIEKEDEVVINEEYKTVVLTKKIKLIDDKFCKKDNRSCEALSVSMDGDVIIYKCEILDEKLFWRESYRPNMALLYRTQDEVLRCEECLKQEREQEGGNRND